MILEHDKDESLLFQENSELDIPNVPEPHLPEGILPKEIRILVERRREVKKLMNSHGVPEWKKQQVGIFLFAAFC
jgi:DNA polymerase alpha subunit A